MYPNADVPIFQVSILKSYSVAAHFDIGRALAPLREQGVLIIGSGLSYHKPSAGFDAWLREVLALPKEQRTEALLNWEQAPYARDCHAQEDHLVPLFVALGAAEDEVTTRTYHQKNMRGGVTASSYKFG